MEKEVLKELVEFAESNGLMRVPLDIVVRMFKSSREGVSKCTHPLFYAQSPDFLKPGLCYFLKFLYL